MEERVPPATAATTSHPPDDEDSRFRHRHRDHSPSNHHHHHHQHIDIYNHNDNDNDNSNNNNNNNNEMQLVSSNPSSNPAGGPPLRTYIVQIPKDQIYRVPPPEHAEIVERYRHRNPAKANGPSTRCICWSLSVFFTLAFLITVIVCVHHFTLSPKPPTFSIKQFTVKQPPASNKNGSPGFKISVGTANPNSHNDIEYSRGSATLVYKDKDVGKGHVPPLDNVEGGKSDAVDVVLNGPAKSALPEKVKSPVTLDLTMTIPVKMKTWMFTKNKEVNVDCEFEVNSLGNNAKILSQSCSNQD